VKTNPVNTFVRGCQAGLIYGGLLLIYAHVVTKGVTRIHDLDFTFFQDLGPFLLIGLGLGGLLGIVDAYTNERVPAWALAISLWAIFVLPSMALTLVMAERYTINVWQHAQGLGFAALLGLAYSFLRRRDKATA
jgi:hypothetical protein